MYSMYIQNPKGIMQKTIINKNITSSLKRADELILVVRRDEILPDEAWIGLQCADIEHYQNLVRSKGQFLWRSAMEQDPSYKQIIPYMIFKCNDRYFLMQRRSNASEKRLQSKFSLGIGGHIRQEDMQGKTIFDWALREFHEEVSYAGSLKIETLGILNDDRDSVGQVHLGFVLLLHGDTEEISIKSEHKEGFLVTADQADQYYEYMESWSQIVLKQLKEKCE